MPNVMIFDPINRFLWGVVFTFYIVCAIQYFNLAKKQDSLKGRIIILGFGGFLLCNSLAWLFWSLEELYIPGHYVGHVYYGDYSTIASNPNYLFFNKMGLFFCNLGLGLFIFSYEYVRKRTKYVLTITNSSIFGISLILPYELGTLIMSMIMLPFNFFVAVVIFFIYQRWSQVNLKAVSSLFVLTSALYFLGIVLYHPLIKELNIFPLFLAQLVLIVSLLIALLPTLSNPERFSKTHFYYVMINLIVISIAWFIFLYLFVIGITVMLFFISLIYVIGTHLLLFFTNRVLKPQQSSEGKEGVPNILSVFTRPQKLTEEEISISKEKRICLVCKSEISRENYNCPECKTFYCSKCAKALSSMENACWVCVAPFDPTKEVKPQPDKVEIQAIEGSIHKKNPK